MKSVRDERSQNPRGETVRPVYEEKVDRRPEGPLVLQFCKGEQGTGRENQKKTPGGCSGAFAQRTKEWHRFETNTSVSFDPGENKSGGDGQGT